MSNYNSSTWRRWLALKLDKNLVRKEAVENLERGVSLLETQLKSARAEQSRLEGRLAQAHKCPVCLHRDQQLAFLEEHLSRIGPPAGGLNPATFDEVARLHGMYMEVEHVIGWADFMSRLKLLRNNLASEILTGTLDKFGNSRDNEKRAALAVLDRIISLPGTIHRQYEDLNKRKEQMEQRSVNAEKDGYYGDDLFKTGT